jgi:hypothetical protein
VLGGECRQSKTKSSHQNAEKTKQNLHIIMNKNKHILPLVDKPISYHFDLAPVFFSPSA